VVARKIIALASDKGYVMKTKNKNTSRLSKDQSKVSIEKDRRQAFWRRIRLQLAAIFLVIVFLASECATILPME
jgi:hypothetical protein